MSLLVHNPVQAQETPSPRSFLKALKTQYKQAQSFTKYQINYHFSFPRAYQAYDYTIPRAGTTMRVSLIDMEKSHYAERDHTLWPGGFIFNIHDFQNDEGAWLYDGTGMLFGKRVRKLDPNSFDRIQERNNAIISFLSPLPLLDNSLDISKLALTHDAARNRITAQYRHKDALLTYVFNKPDMKLLSFHNAANKQKYVFRAYAKRDGLYYATEVTLHNTASKIGTYYIDSLRAIDHIAPDRLSLPEGYGKEVPASDGKLEVTAIAERLHLITDSSADRNTLVKEGEHTLTVFGAPVSDRRSEKTIQLIQETFPDKKIAYVYVTHPHSDHIGGLVAYAKHGATILADAYSIEAIQAYPRFQKDISHFRFRPITHRETFEDVKYYVPKNSHAKGQSFAYFPKAQIIYEGDFLEIPYDNSIPTHMAETEKEFIDFVRMENLAIKRIVGHHRNNNISPDIMDRFYARNTGS